MGKSGGITLLQKVFVGGFVVIALVIGVFIFTMVKQEVDQPIHVQDKQVLVEDLDSGRGDTVINPQSDDHNSPSGPAGIPEDSWRVYGTVTDKATGEHIQIPRVQIFIDSKVPYRSPPYLISTDKNGFYEVVLSKWEVPTVKLAVGVEADGWSSELIVIVPELQPNGLPKDIEVNFELVPGKSVVGKVVDQYQAPVSGAFVGVDRDSIGIFPSVTSDENGLFQLNGFYEEQGEVKIVARAKGYISGSAESRGGDNVGVVITLRSSEAILTGRVVNEEGVSVQGIPVSIKWGGKQDRIDWKYTSQGTEVTQNTYTDDKGSYYFPDVMAGWYIVTAGYGKPVSSSTRTEVFIESGDCKVCNIRLLSPISIKGKFVDGETEKPVSGVRVANMPKGNDEDLKSDKLADFVACGSGVQGVVSDMDGGFKLTLNRYVGYGDWDSRLNLYYKAPEPYQNITDDWKVRRLDRDSIEEEVLINLYPPKSNVVRGTVYDLDGTTVVAGAKVILKSAMTNNTKSLEDISLGENCVLTGSDGSFEISTPKYQFTIIAMNEKGIAQRQAMMTPKLNEIDLNLYLRGYIDIYGQVTDSDDNPVSDVKLTLSQSFPSSQENMYTMSQGSSVTAYTNVFGKYQFEKMPNGGNFLTVQVSSSEKEYLLAPKQTFSVAGDQTVFDHIDFVLPNAVSFEGIVVDQDGQPVKGAVVKQKPPRRPDEQIADNVSITETDKEGIFHFDDLSEQQGLYQFIANCPGYNETIVEDRVLSDSPLTIVLTKMTELEFEVFKDENTSVNDFEYSFEKKVERSPSNEFSHVSYYDDQNFRQAFYQIGSLKTYLSAGEYTLHVYELDSSIKRTGLYGSVDFLIKAGEESKKVTVVLVPEVNIGGVVICKETNEPVNRATVDLVFPSANPMERCVFREYTGNDGAFEFSSVKAGTYTLEATKEKLVQSKTIDLNITQGDEIEKQTIYLSKGSTLYGTITGSDGTPLVDGKVKLTNLERKQYLMTAIYGSDGSVGVMPQLGGAGRNFVPVSENGEYRFEILAPGRMEFLLYQGDQYMREEEVVVGIDEEKEFNIDLRGLVEISGQTPEIYFSSQYVENRPSILLESDLNNDSIPISRTGSYSCSIVPGTYQVFLRVNDAKIVVHSGQQLVVEQAPEQQEHDLLFPIEAVDVVITTEGEENTIQGTLTYIHESQAGIIQSNSFHVNKQRFTLYNQPYGRCRGQFITDDGREFVSDGWVEIHEASEKILTLIPKDLTEEE